ncbi:MarR family winged helix-turn-helix transcriptional regulator [Paracoccus sediminicola]|uniref:MarR family winged helix-turn-helix transcriptional regulator n=1 Tax=Paracoccus sediminicola TaxID=3017783 RepID=UPI0022F09423|nr:MarR family winged helix-turn-helix transcriptional regulator [Paracoccus sediminicola]WBU57640.1 MarR family winged helix-turn-helix transcriptional regulator [Paracoccus sediminicola]
MSKIDENAYLLDGIELGFLARDLSFLSRVLRAHVRNLNADFYREHDPISGSVALLSLIGLNPGISQNDLAAAVVLKKSAVTKIVSRMESEGFVIRDKPKSDRRYNALRLSREGEMRWNDLRNEIRNQQETLLEPLGQRDRDKLFSLLGRLVTHYADTAAEMPAQRETAAAN